MSNMIYSGYTYLNQGEKLIINSNNQSDEFVPIHFKNSERIVLDQQAEKDLPSVNEISSFTDDESTHQKENTLLFSEKAEKILEEAREEAEQIRTEAKVQSKMQADEMLKNARNSGYAEGYANGEAELRRMEAELKQQTEAAMREYREKVLQLEPMFAELTIQMVEKLTGAVVKSKKDVVLHLMEKALLNNESNSQNYTIHVSREDFAVVDVKKKQLHTLLRAGAALEIVEDAGLTKNQCLIETDNKMIDCSLDIQLENLKANLKELAGV